MPQNCVVDANPLMAALLGGKAADVLACDRWIFHSTQHTLFEVERYISELAKQLQRTELEVFASFQALPVTAHQPTKYQQALQQAYLLIGQRDESDVPLLALVLTLGCPVWTNDQDFSGIHGLTHYTTADMVGLLAE